MSKETSALEQVLIDTIQKATSATGEVYDAAKGVTLKAVDFASAQIPDVIHQLLAWKMAESIVYLIVALTILGLIIKFWFNVRDYSIKERDESGIILYTLFIGFFGGGFAIAAIVQSTLTIIKISIAPKLYLIEYAAELLK